MSTVADMPRTSMKRRTLPATSLKDTMVVLVRIRVDEYIQIMKYTDCKSLTA
jgi:hypothetical protein